MTDPSGRGRGRGGLPARSCGGRGAGRQAGSRSQCLRCFGMHLGGANGCNRTTGRCRSGSMHSFVVDPKDICQCKECLAWDLEIGKAQAAELSVEQQQLYGLNHRFKIGLDKRKRKERTEASAKTRGEAQAEGDQGQAHSRGSAVVPLPAVRLQAHMATALGLARGAQDGTLERPTSDRGLTGAQVQHGLFTRSLQRFSGEPTAAEAQRESLRSEVPPEARFFGPPGATTDPPASNTVAARQAIQRAALSRGAVNRPLHGGQSNGSLSTQGTSWLNAMSGKLGHAESAGDAQSILRAAFQKKTGGFSSSKPAPNDEKYNYLRRLDDERLDEQLGLSMDEGPGHGIRNVPLHNAVMTELSRRRDAEATELPGSRRNQISQPHRGMQSEARIREEQSTVLGVAERHYGISLPARTVTAPTGQQAGLPTGPPMSASAALPVGLSSGQLSNFFSPNAQTLAGDIPDPPEILSNDPPADLPRRFHTAWITQRTEGSNLFGLALSDNELRGIIEQSSLLQTLESLEVMTDGSQAHHPFLDAGDAFDPGTEGTQESDNSDVVLVSHLRSSDKTA